ncbi:isochorismatase family protein, partial [Planctomycetota bacterium]
MQPSLLLTQCLQNDFVKPIGRFEPIPNRLHVGFAEAKRLMGENPAEGPVARTMRWAYGLPDDQLRVIHLRDWHDTDDASQKEHLAQFGEHCIRETEGAAFAFSVDNTPGKDVAIVDSLTLNDFEGTSLAEVMKPYASAPHRVGLIGVWTEAKISFLAYELRTRYPGLQLAVCSALAASSSRHHHFHALDQLQRILGVQVIDSLGGFVEFLGGTDKDAPLLGISDRYPTLEATDVEIPEADETLIRYLFRDCRVVNLRILDGGYSGNFVAGAESVDMDGHDQVPHVVKIGPQKLIGQERTSFERVQEVLGNNAPQITEFADYGDRGAIKYRYASMGGSFATTFQKQYMSGIPLDEVRRVLDTVFGEQLMRLYQAATLESCDLLEHYAFAGRWAPGVRSKVEALLGAPQPNRTVEILEGVEITNICEFYEQTLSHLPRRPGDQCYQAFLHGDLNGANIILDGHGNVWLIDFFHTHRGHVLKDLVKFENDLLFIFTPVENDDDLRRAFKLTDALMAVGDLAAPLPDAPAGLSAGLVRAWETVRILRSYYPELIHADRDPFQLWVAVLRYAVHTLGFFESNDRQKLWALYTASRCVDRIVDALHRSTELRLDWVDEKWT